MSDIPTPDETGGEPLDGEDLDLGVEDEGGEEPPPEDLDQPEPEAAAEERRPSRAQSRIQRLQQERDEARRQAAEAEGYRRALEQRNQQAAPVDPYAQQRAEQEFLASLQQMDPYQAAIAIRDRERAQVGNALVQMQRDNAERLDRMEFNSLVRTDAEARRLAPEVERLVSQARAGGDYQTTRQTVYELLYGREALARRQGLVPRQRAQAQRRVAQQTTRPASGRGDVATGGRVRDQGSADEALLRGVTVGDL